MAVIYMSTIVSDESEELQLKHSSIRWLMNFVNIVRSIASPICIMKLCTNLKLLQESKEVRVFARNPDVSASCRNPASA